MFCKVLKTNNTYNSSLLIYQCSDFYGTLVYKDITKSVDNQAETLFSLPSALCGKKLNVSFDAPDLSSNGGLLLVDALECSFLDKISQLIPDYREHLCEASHKWIKDMKYLKSTRMSCNSFRANQFRLFLYTAAYVMIHSMKNRLFKSTHIRSFTTDSFIKHIMLSAVRIQEKKTLVKVSFVKEHRYREETQNALCELAAT